MKIYDFKEIFLTKKWENWAIFILLQRNFTPKFQICRMDLEIV